MEPQSIRYVLMVQDMDRAAAFYTEAMGFELACSSPDWSEVHRGDVIIGLHAGGDGSQCQSGLSFQYEDVAAAFTQLLSQGATAVCHPEQREGEPIIFASLEDTEGNVLMMTQYLGEG